HLCFFFFQAEDGIRDRNVTGVQTCALPILSRCGWEGTGGPSCRIRTPWSKSAPPSSSAETNCEEPEESKVTSPPRTAPVPRTVKGRAPLPPSVAPVLRSEEHTSELQSRFDL